MLQYHISHFKNALVGAFSHLCTVYIYVAECSLFIENAGGSFLTPTVFSYIHFPKLSRSIPFMQYGLSKLCLCEIWTHTEFTVCEGIIELYPLGLVREHFYIKVYLNDLSFSAKYAPNSCSASQLRQHIPVP